MKVLRNQNLSIADCLALHPSHLVIGPGPGAPSESGISLSLIQALAGHVPILGVCLGHQAIAELYGGEIIRANYPMHGKSSLITHDAKGIFQQIPQSFRVTRYHSLIVKKEGFPHCLEISALSESGEIMGLRHRNWDIEGVQFHPESILTEHGFSLLRNFLDKRKTTL